MDENNSTKTIICLAASRKTGGKCIAGKDESENSIWIRPVADGKEGAVDNKLCCYANGQLVQVLDIIEIPIRGPKPTQHQKENFFVDSRKKWQKKGVFDRKYLNALLDNPSSLWQDLDSSYYGKNDRIPVDKAKEITCSLLFIQAQCKILVNVEGKAFNNPHKKVRCSFNYRNNDYTLSVTDPVVEKKYIAKPEGEYDIGERYICVSLGLEFDGYLYLFVATIL